MFARFSDAVVLACLIGLGAAGLCVAQDKKDAKDNPSEQSIAGKWKTARGETVFNYDFKTDGTYYLQVKSPCFFQSKNGKWEQDGEKITVRQSDSGAPGTGGFSKGREIKVKILPGNKLQIDGDAAELVARAAAPSGPRRLQAIADKLIATGRYDAKDGVTKCSQFARDTIKQRLNRDLPELVGEANDQIEKLSGSSAWEEVHLVFDENAPRKDNGKTTKELQNLQNKGKTVLYGWQHPEYRKDLPEKDREKLHGHILVGMPLQGKDMPTSGTWGLKGKRMPVPAIAQAGDDTFSYGPLSDGFGADKKDKIRVFVYKDQ